MIILIDEMYVLVVADDLDEIITSSNTLLGLDLLVLVDDSISMK